MNRIAADLIGSTPREVVLEPGAAARAALADRLRIPAITALRCRFTLSRNRAGTAVAKGRLDALVVQEDVTDLQPFESAVGEVFALRFVPEDSLRDTLDPADPEDEVALTGGTIDLAEAMAQQLALALDPYPRRIPRPASHTA